MTGSTAVMDPHPAGAACGRRVGHALFSSLYRASVVDPDKVPASGPVLLASNHTGILDGPLVFGLSPRPAHFLVKTELFHGPLGWVLDRQFGTRWMMVAGIILGAAVGFYQFIRIISRLNK